MFDILFYGTVQMSLQLQRLTVLALATVFTGCESAPLVIDEAAYGRSMASFKVDRRHEIGGTDGWITLVGLFWLVPGANAVGSDASNPVRLPADRAPARLGTFWVHGDSVRFAAVAGTKVMADSQPATDIALSYDAHRTTILSSGTLSMTVLERGGKLGLRVKDSAHPARAAFADLSYFPIDTTWRVRGKLVRHAEPETLQILNVLGMVTPQSSAGTLEFAAGGKSHRLDVYHEGTDSSYYFVLFKDSTSTRETYPAGRYLKVVAADMHDRVVIDFNRAYNPPCAFTAFATCPLPPRQNALALRVTAGELRPVDEH